MTDKVFPIKSDTACLLKWAWSTVFLHTRTTSSCHRVNQDDITLENFGSFHNTPQKILAREKMIKGEWPAAGCEYCKKIEDAGGLSDRQLQLSVNQFDVPPELHTDPTATTVSPTILEIYFSNVCNMGCLYCGSRFSSVWEAENTKFGTFTVPNFGTNGTVDAQYLTVDNPDNYGTEYPALVDALFDWLENNYKSITKFQILGGEPFYQITELERCIDFYDKHPAPHTDFCIVSNLKVAPAKFHQIINRLLVLQDESKIKGVNITGSIDCWGSESEYVRHGLDLDQYTTNIEYLLDKKITVCINSTINSLSIKTTPELVEKINYWNSIRKTGWHPIFWTFMTVQPKNPLCPEIFDSDFFRDDFDKILSLMPTDTEFQVQTKEYMVGIAKQLSAVGKNQDKINGLKLYLNELDRRRNTNWKEIFPWLIDQ